MVVVAAAVAGGRGGAGVEVVGRGGGVVWKEQQGNWSQTMDLLYHSDNDPS